MSDEHRNARTATALPLYPPQTASNAARTVRTERIMIASLALGGLLIPFNTTMIAVLLPQLRTDINANSTTVGWLITAYLIAMACLQPVAGKLGDRWGRRPLIVGGLAWFGLASAGVALAPNMALILIFRVQQAIAGALALPNGAALVREIIPSERRAARFGQLSAAMALGAAIGPPISGLFLASLGWRGLFALNIPLALLAAVLGWWSIPQTTRQPVRYSFDMLGLTLLPAILAGVSWLLMQSQNLPAALVLGSALALLLAALCFGWYEWRSPDPVLQPRLFRHRAFSAATSTIALTDVATYTTLLLMPVLLSRQAGWETSQIGLALIALSATTILLAPFGGQLADRVGRRWPAVIGMVGVCAGELLLAVTHGNIWWPFVIGGFALVGAGWGLAAPSLQAAAVEAVEPTEIGMASGVMTAVRFLGSITGSSILVSLLGPSWEGGAFGTVFVVIVAAALLGTLASFGLHDHPPARE